MNVSEDWRCNRVDDRVDGITWRQSALGHASWTATLHREQRVVALFLRSEGHDAILTP
ncbi:hypothetical protein HAX54_036379, partial [Datura stramonium]|nr:hypothetical protein [Datura stramonium]